MARKLKTYVTSAGFFDLAVAAPTMKAALEAWGSARNLFQQGFAQETNDPTIVAATMAKPGVVLKRAVGSNGVYAEDAELPKTLPVRRAKEPPRPKAKVTRPPKHNAKAKVFSLAEARAAKQAAAAFEKEKARRETEDRKEQAVRAREGQRRSAAAAKVQAALEKARRAHREVMDGIGADREALDKRADAEEARWRKEIEKLEDKLRRIRN